MKHRHGLLFILSWLFLCLLAACARRTVESPPEAEEQPVLVPRSVPVPLDRPRPLAFIKSGKMPLWFELDSVAPLHIPDVEAASLRDFNPWPQVPHITGMLIRGRRLIMAVNRAGFLILDYETADTHDLALYQAVEGESWGSYTAGSPFFYEEIPTVLLYRHTVFTEALASAPAYPLWGLEERDLRPFGLTFPALSELPDRESWDVDALQQGRNGRWYYRAGDKSADRRGSRYYETADLRMAGKASSAGVFRNAALPYTIGEAMPVLRRVLEEMFRQDGASGMGVAAVSSPEFPETRYFSNGGDPAGSFKEIAAYYRGPSEGEEARALAVDSAGQGVYAAGPGEGDASRSGDFFLPVLGEGFVYTRIGMVGSVLVASWEEQQDGAVGAAGFLVIQGPW